MGTFWKCVLVKFVLTKFVLTKDLVYVHKLLVHGHCLESGLHSPLSRSFQCPLINTLKRLHVRYSEVGQKLIKPKKSAQKNYMISFLLDLKAPKEGVSGSSIIIIKLVIWHFNHWIFPRVGCKPCQAGISIVLMLMASWCVFYRCIILWWCCWVSLRPNATWLASLAAHFLIHGMHVAHLPCAAPYNRPTIWWNLFWSSTFIF